MTEPAAPPVHDDARAFAEYTAEVKHLVQAELARFLEEDHARVAQKPLLREIHEAIVEYVDRGGKRVRAVLCAAAYEGLGGNKADIKGALLAVELLHAYLLVHDDWMDRDDRRRGGPTLHVAFAERRDAHRGASAAVLAGDYLCATAQRALLTARVDDANLRAAFGVFSIMQRDVVWGQMLDTLGAGETPEDIEAMHALKTASYTADGPLALGATLAGASEALRTAIAEAARPLGIAFQLNDDLASIFADGSSTGKARFGDLREGKCSSIVAEGVRDEAFRARWQDHVRTRTALSPSTLDARVEAMAEELVSCGARARVEARRGDLVRRAKVAISATALSAPMRHVLCGFGDSLVAETFASGNP